ncbi:hypothetical protein ACP6PL_06775 [Dapis sp. BLCC M126]|uniref:hypothetical protein n=1 Tax=Dapis sp. BLCC M126 TaxID=3400189 RepID=UPI003CF60B60
MANITISELRPAGTELFLDSESFVNELIDEELSLTKGGFITTVVGPISPFLFVLQF